MDLIVTHLEAVDRLAASEATPMSERETSELREQFIAVLGHNLRNPPASIEHQYLGHQGLGLGLYIASEIARAHHDTIGGTSSPQETRFTFRMPL